MYQLADDNAKRVGKWHLKVERGRTRNKIWKQGINVSNVVLA
jgi:hypothetical protein